MQEFWNSLQHFIDPEKLLKEGGFYVVMFVIFAETGLFFGFFLPGDYLLFLAGMFVATGKLDVNIYVLILGLVIAAISGNFTGYWFGYKTGPLLYKRKDTFFFKKKYLLQSQEFFQKHGGKAIIYARFLPIVRTFVPIIAGIVHMKKTKFMFYNVLSSLMWSFFLVFAGHYLYGMFLNEFDIDLKKHIEKIILILIGVTTFPLVMKAIKARKNTENLEE